MQYQVGDLIRYDSKPPLYGILFAKSEIETCTIHWFNGIRNEYFLEELKYKNYTNLSRL